MTGLTMDDTMAVKSKCIPSLRKFQIGDRVRFTDAVDPRWWFKPGQTGTILAVNDYDRFQFEVAIDDKLTLGPAFVDARHIELIPSPSADQIRVFDTGATRDQATTKPDYEGFMSPLVVEAFGAYMHFNRRLPDGSLRASDNWQLGIPQDQYIKSGWRHFLDWWKSHRGYVSREGIVWAILGLLFNAQGYLHELLRDDPTLLERSLTQAEARRAK